MQSCLTTYEVEISTISDFEYRKPLVQVDDHGELQTRYRENGRRIPVRNFPFLSIVGYDNKGKLVSYEPIEMVNQFLVCKAVDDGVFDLGTTARGIAHYFSFILDEQAKWDSEQLEIDGEFDPFFDEPRPQWDHFPRHKQDRLTFKYRRGAVELASAGVLAQSTVKQYVSSVTAFYKYCLRNGYRFNNPPFTFEKVTLFVEGSKSSMKSYRSIDIQTTDMRVKFDKSTRTGGDGTNSTRRDLRAFTNSEWKDLQNVLMKSRSVIRNNRKDKMHSLPIEFCLHPMICRLSGLRREEAASLHCGQIPKPKYVIKGGVQQFEQPILEFGVGSKYGSFTKTQSSSAEENKSRTTIIPASFMLTLYEYTQSERYKKRLSKFKSWCKEQKEKGNTHYFEGNDAVNPDLDYLFITQTGKPMFLRLTDFTGRWCEVRNTANLSRDESHAIVGSLHNLRATFAVNIFRYLLDKKDEEGNPSVTPAEALDKVSALLGHEDIKVTMIYLQMAQDMPSGDEVYEDVLDFLGAFDELDSAL